MDQVSAPRSARTVLAILLLSLSGACSGQAGPGPAQQSRRAAPGGSAAFLPAPSALRAGSFTDLAREKTGDYYTYIGGGFEDHLSINGSNLQFSPEWGASVPPSLVDAARAMYDFNLTDYDSLAEVSLSWLSAPAAADMWIGGANFAANRWDWVNAAGFAAFPAPPADYLGPTGHAFVALVLLGTAPAELISIRYGPPLWQRETPLSATDNVGQYTSITVDALDHPHISYYDVTHHDLRYCSFDGSAWTDELVDGSDHNAGVGTSIGIGHDGYPQIAYYVADTSDLLFATRGPGGWSSATVAASNVAGLGPSLRHRADSTPYISYYDATLGAVRLAHYDGTVWQKETAAPSAGINTSTSLALDSQGYAHIAFANSAGEIHYAWFDGLTWQTSPAYTETLSSLDASRALALDADGKPGIGFYEQGSLAPAYAHWDGAAWQVEILPVVMPSGAGCNLLYDSQNQPNLFFYGDGLERRYFDGSAWRVSSISEAGWTGHYICSVLDSQGKFQLSYYSPSESLLKYVKQL